MSLDPRDEIRDAIRVEMWRRGLRIFEVGGRAGIHPHKLGRALRGREPFTEDMERRVRRVLDEETALERRLVGELDEPAADSA